MQSKHSLYFAFLALMFVALIFPGRAASAGRAKRHDTVSVDSANLDPHQLELARARQEVLKILQSQNGCSAWFRETDPDAAEIFRSLRLEIVDEKITYIMQSTDGHGGFLFKHPWAARTRELAGRNATVEFNLNGPFFLSSLQVVEALPSGASGQYRGFRALTIGSFRGRSLAAQMTTLFHELAHVIGRVPVDDDSWDGRSGRNTGEVLRNCKSEILYGARAAEHPESQLAELRAFSKLD